MPITINGSTGISGVDGSAGTPALIGSDADTGLVFGAGKVAASINGNEANIALVSATAQASTSGANIDFTGIPSWAKRITVMFSNISTNGTNSPIVQLGDSGGIESTGYTSNAADSGGRLSETTGFAVSRGVAASDVLFGVLYVSLLDATTNTWVAMGTSMRTGSANTYYLSGSKALSAPLDRVRVTTIGGTDTFDAGSINILYE